MVLVKVSVPLPCLVRSIEPDMAPLIALDTALELTVSELRSVTSPAMETAPDPALTDKSALGGIDANEPTAPVILTPPESEFRLMLAPTPTSAP